MRFTISILAHNNLELTKRCLASVIPTLGDDEVILTNNGSKDDTAEFLRECIIRWGMKSCSNPVNLGFQEPNRRALEIASGEFFLMLNNDTTVSPDWLDKIEDRFNDPDVWAVGPDCNRRTLLANFIGVPSKPGYMFDYLEGSCLAVRRKEIRELGLFDPNLRFCCGEDSDLCLRIRQSGHRLGLAYFPFHHEGGQTMKLVPGVASIIRENNEYLTKKWASYLVTRRFAKCA